MLGVWMWPESLRLRGAEAVFDACRRAGVTDVFFLTKGLAGTTAFLTPLAPPMSPGRDLLREALDAAHRRGLRLHAWVTSASDARYKAEHPESGLCHYARGRDRDIVSIAHEPYIRFMQGLLADLVRRFEVDGVHLDYIRYNHLLYGWSAEDQADYAARGVDLASVRRLMDQTFYGGAESGEAIFDAFRRGDPDVIRLAGVRRARVNAFAHALAGALRAEKSGLVLSAALMPEGAYDDLAFADLHYGQNYADLSALMDAFLPMAYSQAYGKGPEWVGQVARGAARHGVPAVIGLQAYEGGTGLTLRQDWDAAAGAAGRCLFREGAAAWAFLSGRRLSLLNPLAKSVTACRIAAGGESALIETPAAPGAQRDFQLPFSPDIVQAYAGEEEVCVFTVRE